MKPLVTLIITTKNEEKDISTLLKSIQNQTYFQYCETIVVDNYSSDKTGDIVKKFGFSFISFGPERSSQRNEGARRARGNYLLFLDADMKLDPMVIEECISIINEGTENIGGIIIPEISYGVSFWAKIKAYERSFYIGDTSVEAARFFKNKIFQQMNGFDEKITGPEDWDLSERVNKKYPLGHTKSYIYHNEGNVSLIDLVKKKYYYALKLNSYLDKQNASCLSPKTVYFLRMSFWRNWKKLLFHPVLTFFMVIMLTAEMCGGAYGYFKTKLFN